MEVANRESTKWRRMSVRGEPGHRSGNRDPIQDSPFSTISSSLTSRGLSPVTREDSGAGQHSRASYERPLPAYIERSFMVTRKSKRSIRLLVGAKALAPNPMCSRHFSCASRAAKSRAALATHLDALAGSERIRAS